MDNVIMWLLEGEPWVEYRTRLDLMAQSESDKEVTDAYEKMLYHPRIKLILTQLSRWSEEVVSSHKSAGLLIHKLAFLADIGLSIKSPEVEAIVRNITRNITDDGIVQVRVNIPQHYGGTGEDTWGWALCDTPLILYSLLKLGLKEESAIGNGLNKLRAMARENAWPCAVSPELGKFRGPGKKGDPCPYATLLMLKALSQTQTKEFKDCREAHIGAEVLLELWVRSRDMHPYMFYMGTDFRKLKAPLIWYDILHVANTLTQFDWLRKDARLIEMLDIISSKADTEGKFTPESEWKAWKGWDFGQKKQPSEWLTLLALRSIKALQ